jgi:hypothetical protein
MKLTYQPVCCSSNWAIFHYPLVTVFKYYLNWPLAHSVPHPRLITLSKVLHPIAYFSAIAAALARAMRQSLLSN